MGGTAHGDEMRRRYRWVAPLFDATRRWSLLGRDAFARRLAFPAGARVLEVGCGTGQITARLREAAGPGGSVVGVDCSPEMLAVARRKGLEGGGTRLVLGDYGCDPAPVAGPFDAVVLSYTLSMVEDFEPLLDRVEADLAPGGTVAVCDFLDSGFAAVKAYFAANHAFLGPERQASLRRRFEETASLRHPAPWGLWTYYEWAGRARR